MIKHTVTPKERTYHHLSNFSRHKLWSNAKQYMGNEKLRKLTVVSYNPLESSSNHNCWYRRKIRQLCNFHWTTLLKTKQELRVESLAAKSNMSVFGSWHSSKTDLNDWLFNTFFFKYRLIPAWLNESLSWQPLHTYFIYNLYVCFCELFCLLHRCNNKVHIKLNVQQSADWISAQKLN